MRISKIILIVVIALVSLFLAYQAYHTGFISMQLVIFVLIICVIAYIGYTTTEQRVNYSVHRDKDITSLQARNEVKKHLKESYGVEAYIDFDCSSDFFIEGNTTYITSNGSVDFYGVCAKLEGVGDNHGGEYILILWNKKTNDLGKLTANPNILSIKESSDLFRNYSPETITGAVSSYNRNNRYNGLGQGNNFFNLPQSQDFANPNAKKPIDDEADE